MSVGYHSELCFPMTCFPDTVIFYQLSYIIIFGVHTNYLYYLGENNTLSKI